MNKNTIVTLTVVALTGFSLMGCGKKNDSSGNSHSAAKQDSGSVQTLLNEWQQGNKPTAISRFVETDWSARPLFPATSPLSLSEDQFKSLSASDRETKATEITAQTGVFKQLAAGVAQAGMDAAGKKDIAQARKYFTALKQSGEALDSSGSLAILKLVGQSIKKKGETELAKLGQ